MGIGEIHTGRVTIRWKRESTRRNEISLPEQAMNRR